MAEPDSFQFLRGFVIQGPQTGVPGNILQIQVLVVSKALIAGQNTVDIALGTPWNVLHVGAVVTPFPANGFTITSFEAAAFGLGNVRARIVSSVAQNCVFSLVSWGL